ncbi:MAG: hypothetical protein PW735_08250 [Acidobacteriaceae bacterium]|nr:hypothetical protein [Acidobacteriaceae bacterium]
MTPKKIAGLIISVALIIALYTWWRHTSGAARFMNGDVLSLHDGDNGPSTKGSVDSGAVDLDGQSSGTYASGNSAVSNQPPRPQPIAAPQAVAQPIPPAQTNALPPAAPAQDTLQPNSPNGMAFGGTGKYQWYRQGDITWRINTLTGSSCIAFATMEEWAKPIVYSHGCGNNA